MFNPDLNSRETQEVGNDFDSAPESEQIERFAALKALFVDKNNGADEKSSARANFFKFTEGFYKRVEGMPLYIDGVIASHEKKNEIANDVRKGNLLIADALVYFQTTKSYDGSAEDEEQNKICLAQLNRDVEMYGGSDAGEGFAQRSNKQLNVDKLVDCFRWSLKTYVMQGEVYGVPEGLVDEIEPLSEDLEVILRHVNAYR